MSTTAHMLIQDVTVASVPDVATSAGQYNRTFDGNNVHFQDGNQNFNTQHNNSYAIFSSNNTLPTQVDIYNIDSWIGEFYNLSTETNTTDNGSKTYGLEPYSWDHLIVSSSILGLLILATIIGNVLVIAAIVLEKNLHGVANYLIMSLAFTDLGVAVCVMPLVVVNEISKYWFLGQEVCDFFISLDVLLCTASILHLVAIAVDRYWAVTSIDYIRRRTAKRMRIMIAIVWIVSICISLPPVFGWKDTDNNVDITGQCLISQDWSYTIFSTLGAFYLPLVGMLIIYYKIWRAARSRIRKNGFRNKVRYCPENATLVTTEGETMHLPIMSALKQNGHKNGSCESVPESVVSNGSLLSHHDTNGNTRTPTSTQPSPTQSVNIDFSVKKPKIKKTSKDRAHRDKLEQKRERKAARTLAIITGCFCFCWFPFFVVAVVRPFCGDHCAYPATLMSIIGWLGYSNSLLNPIIYTIFSPDFRNAFRKIILGKLTGCAFNNR